MTRIEIQRSIETFIAENFLYMHDDVQLSEHDSLLGNGIIDSMGVMEMIGFLEAEFGISIPDQDITEANLGTVAAITRLVDARSSSNRAVA